MSDDRYCYPPDFKVLRNKLDILDAKILDRAERELVVVRLQQPLPDGDFDLIHLRAIHRHLFQDVYDWAGDLREVEIFKGGTQFQFRRFIQTGIADVHARLKKSGFLQNLTPERFATEAGKIIGDINHVHPFRDGNGRTQLSYLKLLAKQAGHDIDLSRLDKTRWIAASIAANRTDYGPMGVEIGRVLGQHKKTDQNRSDTKDVSREEFLDTRKPASPSKTPPKTHRDV